MSTTKLKIHTYFLQATDPSADQALILAFRRSSGAHQEEIMGIMIATGRASATSELIRNYHTYPEKWRNMMHAQIDHLYNGLRLLASDDIIATRLNVISIIKATHHFRLADLVGMLLRDKNNDVKTKAKHLFITLGTQFRLHFNRYKNYTYQDNAPRGHDNKKRDLWIFLNTLENAMRTYRVHLCNEIIYAAMCAVPATDDIFWKKYLLSYSHTGKAVREFIVNQPKHEHASFYISALANNDLRATAIRAISRFSDNEMITKLAMAYTTEDNQEIYDGIHRVRETNWFDKNALDITHIDNKGQISLVAMVNATGIKVVIKSKFQLEICISGTEMAALKAFEHITRLPEELSAPLIKEIANKTIHSEVATMAFKAFLAMNVSGKRHFITSQIKSPHQLVSKAAMNKLKGFAFETYWKNFSSMSTSSRISAGKAILKIDDSVLNHWQKKTTSRNSQDRIQAIQFCCALSWQDEQITTILKLADDIDAKVRSCAITALGEISSQSGAAGEERLVAALKDKNMRVRANAIDALFLRSVTWAQGHIEQCLHSNHNRIRANAIKALLVWRVASAKKAIKEMRADIRPQHRQSAQWVIRNLNKFKTQTAINELINVDNVEETYV